MITFVRIIQTLILSIFVFVRTADGASSDPVVTITETDPPMKIGYKGIVKVPKNRDAHLMCVVDNKPINTEVQWMKYPKGLNELPVIFTTDTESTDPFKYHVDKPSPLAWRLKIQNVQPSDKDVYACRVRIGPFSYAKDLITIEVTEIPQISDLKTSSDMTDDAGKPITLECNATGMPFPQVKWTKMAGGLLPIGGLELRDYKMKINSLKPSDRGKYKCTAANEAGADSRLISLTVRFAPQLTPDSPRVSQMIGYLKELVCYIEAYPTPDDGAISWVRDGKSIVHGGNYEIKHIRGASSKKMTKLTIKNVQPEDYGTYTCAARNNIPPKVGSAKIILLSSDEPTVDRAGNIRKSGAPFLSVSLLTCIMLLSVCFLLHL